MASEASFAALAGTNPLDASSGKQQRHRLNRGGDRQLNWALHVIALNASTTTTRTASYYQRLLANGKTAKRSETLRQTRTRAPLLHTDSRDSSHRP